MATRFLMSNSEYSTKAMSFVTNFGLHDTLLLSEIE